MKGKGSHEAAKRVRVRAGEIWRCGGHRIMCGSSTNPFDVEKLVGGRRAQLMLTDPPYGVAVGDRNIAVFGGIREKLKNDDLDEGGMVRLWTGAFGIAANGVMSAKASFCAFAPQGPLMVRMAEALDAAGLKHMHTWIWVKPRMVMGRCDRHYRHEPIMYGWRTRGTHEWKGDRKMNSVLEFSMDSRGHGHPTVKPTLLLMDLLYPLTSEGDWIYDPFAGSGSILLACERSGRRALAMELDPKFASMAVSRWQEATGREAKTTKR